MFNPKEILGKANPETKELLADLLADMMLNDESLPECRKIDIRIAVQVRSLEEKLTKAFMDSSKIVESLEEAEADYPRKKEALEYIQLMSAGLDSFLAAYAPEGMADATGGEKA